MQKSPQINIRLYFPGVIGESYLVTQITPPRYRKDMNETKNVIR